MEPDQHALATYVSDVLAVERQIRIPLEAHRTDDDVQEYGDAAGVVNRIVALSDMHIETLKLQLDRLGGRETIKSAVTHIEGFVAGAIDKVRKTKVSRALRDEYTSLALCTVAYSELVTAAIAFRDAEVLEIAERHLADYANAIMEIGECIPGVVTREMQFDVDLAVVDDSRQAISQAWHRTARPFHEKTDAQDFVSGP